MYIQSDNNKTNNAPSFGIWKHIIVSAMSSCIAEISTLPLCTLKTNYQNTENISITQTFRSIWNKYGIRGFYNASGWAISSQMLSTTTKYTWYQTLKDTIPNKFIAGGISGILASLMTHPFDVIKIHYQMHTPFTPELRKYGLKLFYRGYSKTLIKSSLGSVCFFPLYDMFNSYTNNSFIASILSATVSTTIMQPIDYMKTRQIYGNFIFFKQSPLTTLSNLFQHKSQHTHTYSLYHHINPCFKGLTLNLSRVVPHFVITMMSIEGLNKLL